MIRTTALKMYREEILKIDRQFAMAELLGVSPNHYNMMEKGTRGISTDLIKKISDLSGKPMDEVYYDFKSHEVTTLNESAAQEAI